MLINVEVNSKEQAKEFINNILKDLGKDTEVDNTTYTDNQIEITPELRSQHHSEGRNDISIESSFILTISIKDLDFETQEVVKKHKNQLHRL